jgi:RsiW-degrading membrane proteinase PrsW (M82 family)
MRATPRSHIASKGSHTAQPYRERMRATPRSQTAKPLREHREPKRAAIPRANASQNALSETFPIFMSQNSELLLLALALAPAVAIMMYVYFQDVHEKEPIWMLIKMFAFGLLSVVVTLILSTLMGKFVEFQRGVVLDQFLYAFFGVALVEEFSKMLFVMIAFRSRHFNEPFDGIVYAVMVSMGFAALENVLYVFSGGIETALLRMFTAVPAHGTFGVLMGYFMGRAKFEPNRRGVLLWWALGSAVIFHGFYDFFLFISFIPGIWIGAFVSLFVGLWLTRKAMRQLSDDSPFNIESKVFWKRFNAIDFKKRSRN